MIEIKQYGDVTEFKAAKTILGRPIYKTHFYYLGGLLIDTGPHHIADEILEALQDYPPEKVVITHHHEDHTGNCRRIKEEFGAPIYARAEAAGVLANPPEIEIYRKIMWGGAPAVKTIPLYNYIDAGGYRLEAIHTGGHSYDHTCYFEPQNRWLFAGDFYLGENLNGFMVGENIAEHLTGLERLIALEPEVIYCGLKGRLTDAKDRLVRKYNSWWNLCCKVKELYEAGKPSSKILSEVFGGEIFFYYFSQNNWGRRFMLDTILNNLDYFNENKRTTHKGCSN